MQFRIRMAVILTGVALICIVATQLIWLYQSYWLNYALFDKYANRVLNDAIDEEFNIRSKAEFDQIILTKDDDVNEASLSSLNIDPEDTIVELELEYSEHTNLQDRIRYALNLSVPPSMKTIDSIYSEMIKKEYPNEIVFIEITNRSGDSVIQSLAKNDVVSRNYTTGSIPLDKYSEQAVRGVFFSPLSYWPFKQMTGVMILSVLFVALTVGCTLYVIQVVFKQRKYTQSVTDYTHYTVHQMQTPIMLATLSLKRLQTKSKENTALEVGSYIDISEKNLKKLSSLSDSLLYMAVQEHSTMQITREPFNISESVKAMAEEFPLKQPEKQIQISVNDQLKESVIAADQLHLCNAIGNLIDNAIKYSGQQVSVGITLESVPGGIRILVKDNGPGISKEHVAHIFDRFYRVVNTESHQVKGFGLGLSYVRAVCEAHGGSIHVKSKEGEGCEFRIEIQ